MKTINRGLVPLAVCLAIPTLGKAADNTRNPDVDHEPVVDENSGQAVAKTTSFKLVMLKEEESGNVVSGTSNESGATDGQRKRRSIEEVIVTATKRSELLQNVPMSVAVVTAVDIEERGIVNAEDYLRGIPAVSQTNGAFGGPAIIIRGIVDTTSFQNYGSGPTVATYFGETPTTNSGGVTGGSNVDTKLADIERVEVLRGPQGTAFGTSSMGGAIRTIPVAPRLDRIEGKVAAGYSVTSGTGGDNYEIQAVGNLPIITDKLAIRATAYQYQDSGYYRNRAGSDAAFQAAAVIPYGAQAFARDEKEVGQFFVWGARVAALFQATEKLRFTFSYLNQETETDGFPITSNGVAFDQQLLQVAPEHVRRGQTGGLADSNLEIANAVVEYDLGWADLLGTYSYLEGGAPVIVPATYLNLPWPVSFSTTSHNRQNVGEIRLATRLDGAWNFLVGLYAEDVYDDYSYNWLWHGDPATNFFPSGTRDLGTYFDQRDRTQTAVFGEASWKFSPKFTLTGGVRAYEYERKIQSVSTGDIHGGGASEKGGIDASGTTFRGNLSYKPNESALVYAGWAEGFRLGKPQPVAPSALCDHDGDGVIDGTAITIESSKFVNSDSLENYEVGSKFALLDRRLTIDATVFRTEWSDIPVNSNPRAINPSACNWGFDVNGGTALSEGVEVQAQFQLTNSFRVDLGGAYIDAHLTEDVPAQGLFSGDPLPGSPKVNGSLSLQYALDFAGHATSLRADTIYVESFPVAPRQVAAAEGPGGYVKVDLAARMTFASLTLDLFVRNLTNEDALTLNAGGIGGGYRLRPRTVGVRLGYDF
ncbi:TonB-dependent receptor [Peristeroidobacter soli]|uniref:TonB-dependent receptor n=1 Tax=Peristeroidobacter soli TaxID=2497877 RepID=UPI00158D4371|nr:TonB-dependent receptor [Peristeroidobacter soli]